jgi:hypothetical protein
MLAVSAIVFEMNGHTPGAVNLRPRSFASGLADGWEAIQVMRALEEEFRPHCFVAGQSLWRGLLVAAHG